MRHGVIGGKWKIIRRLGKGGFAEVYEVEDLQQPGYNVRAVSEPEPWCSLAHQDVPASVGCLMLMKLLPALQYALKIADTSLSNATTALKAEYKVCLFQRAQVKAALRSNYRAAHVWVECRRCRGCTSLAAATW